MKIKVFSFNLRTQVKSDGINAFFNRTDRVLATIREHSPDVIGFQEVQPEMRDWLRENLKEYIIIGCGREKDLGGESVVIGYKKDSIQVIRSETFWLSPTPNVFGSRYTVDQSSCPRIVTSALLKHKDSPTPFLFCNTHLDHVGKNARLMASMQIIQYLSQNAERFILTGDFNAPPESPEVLAITTTPGFTAREATSGLGGTFHGFGSIPEEKREQIDYIFTNLPFSSEESYKISDDGINGVYISDHNPVCAMIEI